MFLVYHKHPQTIYPIHYFERISNSCHSLSQPLHLCMDRRRHCFPVLFRFQSASFTKSRMAAVPFRGENRHVLRNGPPDSNGFIIPRNAALILRMVIIGQLSIKNQACRILVPERGRFSGSISLARSAHPPKGYGFIGCPFL